ncbi:MAG: hypothetical protein ACOX7P_06245 [Oscillospiraceae bacterium]|jgi:hypothetical protein
MLSGNSLSSYLKCFAQQVELEPQLIAARLPLGQAGDRYLAQAIELCVDNPNSIVNYVVPCMRTERPELLSSGSHLSLFYLYMFLFGSNVPEAMINRIYREITSVDQITPKEIAAQSADLFYCQNYRFEKKRIEPAKGFKYTNYAYEMFDERGVEIGNISRFLDEDGIGATTFAFGLERLVMHQFNTSNIWECPAFMAAAGGEKNGIKLDELRKNAFVEAAATQCSPEDCAFGGTLLPYILY